MTKTKRAVPPVWALYRTLHQGNVTTVKGMMLMHLIHMHGELSPVQAANTLGMTSSGVTLTAQKAPTLISVMQLKNKRLRYSLTPRGKKLAEALFG